MCIKYWALHKQTIKIQIPLWRVDDVRDQVGEEKPFSSIDLMCGYLHFRIKNTDVPKTAFRTKNAQFEYLATLFGLIGAPEGLQTLLNDTFRP